MIAMPAGKIRVYVYRLGPYLAASIVLFGIGFVFGLIAFDRFPEWTAIFEKSLAGFVKMFRDLPKFQLAVAIFVNNAVKTLAAILLGVFFGVLPAFFLVLNGAALGLVLTLSGRGRGIGLTLLSIIPHGILELPAVFLGSAIGLMIGASVALKLFTRSEIKIKAELLRALKFFCVVIVPLLFVAAFIEAFVTSALVAR